MCVCVFWYLRCRYLLVWTSKKIYGCLPSLRKVFFLLLLAVRHVSVDLWTVVVRRMSASCPIPIQMVCIAASAGLWRFDILDLQLFSSAMVTAPILWVLSTTFSDVYNKVCPAPARERQ